ncbi:hypothetical protein V6N13_084862 [Hibiscus sabdariffa]
MEGFDGWLYESFNCDFAIQRFCSAIVELDFINMDNDVDVGDDVQHFQDEIEVFSIANDEFGDTLLMTEGDGWLTQSAAMTCTLQLVNAMQIWAPATPLSDLLQRISYCFVTGLKSRLLLLQNVNDNGTIGNHAVESLKPAHRGW